MKSIPEPYQQHVVEAWHQLSAGKKPTADSVLQVVRGSKATAVSAMQFFWTTYLPHMMSGRTAEIPDPIAQLAAGMWERAMKLATDRAESAVAIERKALEDSQTAITQEREGFTAARLRHQAALADLNASLSSRIEKALTAERTKHEAALTAERKRHEAQENKSARSITSLEHAAENLRGEKDRLKDDLRAAEQQTASTQRTLATTEAELSAAKDQITQLMDIGAQRLSEAQKANDSLERAAAEHRSERDALAQQHATDLERIRTEHAAELTRLNQHHESTMLELKLAHDARVTDLKKSIPKVRRSSVKS